MIRRHTAVALALAGALCTSVGLGCRERERDDSNVGAVSEPEEPAPPPQYQRSQPSRRPDDGDTNSFEATAKPEPNSIEAQNRADPGALRGASGFRDHRAEVRVVTTELDSMDLLIPSTVVMTAGADQNLHLLNQSSSDRRVVIEGLGVDENVTAGHEETIPLPRLESNSIYAIRIEAATPTATTTQPPANPDVPGSPSPRAEAPSFSATAPTPSGVGPEGEPVPVQHGTLIVLGEPSGRPASGPRG